MNRMSPPTGVHASPVATPGSLSAPLDLGVDARPAEQLPHPLHVDGVALAGAGLALGDLARQLAADGADLALEVAHAGLARVRADDLASAASVKLTWPGLRPLASICFGTRYLRAICSFSSIV